MADMTTNILDLIERQADPDDLRLTTGGYSLEAFIDGGSESYNNDHSLPAKKDEVISKIMPDEISECAVHRSSSTVCTSHLTVERIAEEINARGSDEQIINVAKSQLGCKTERCVLQKLAPKLGHDRVAQEISGNLKVQGPTDATLLSNVNIDSVLQQWGRVTPEFYPFNFNMRNYASYSFRRGEVLQTPDTLATVMFEDLYQRGYRVLGCVINSDVYQGPGKHWMALFADARPQTGVWTVEFFNSSGNPPAPEWVNWMIKTKNAMESVIENRKLSVKPEIVKVSNIRHQQSRTECGLYSLFYIWARLNGVPVEYFARNPVPDQLMFEFRQHLFYDGNDQQSAGRKFDWNEYKKRVKVQWE